MSWSRRKSLSIRKDLWCVFHIIVFRVAKPIQSQIKEARYFKRNVKNEDYNGAVKTVI
jgi:hypothetical protein